MLTESRFAAFARTTLEESLLNLAEMLGVDTTLDTVLERIVADARRMTGAEAGTLYLVRDGQLHFAVVQNELLERHYGRDEMRRQFQAHVLAFSEPSLAAHVACTGATLNIDDVYANHTLPATFHRALDEASGYFTRSMLAMPLRTPDGMILGVLQLINARSAPDVIVPFSDDAAALTGPFASLASVAIHRAQLLEGTFRDSLTELYNRRYLALRVQEEAERHSRSGHPVSVVTMDLDGFQQVNDRAGRVGGDAMLREVGALLRRHSRRFTLLGRDHGDDFAAVLPGTSKSGAMAYAERIRAVLGAHEFSHGPVTASFGVASLPETSTDPKTLLATASDCGRGAKRRGGNCVAAA